MHTAEWQFGQNDTLARNTLAKTVWPEWYFGQSVHLARDSLAQDTLAGETISSVSLWLVTLWSEWHFGHRHFGQSDTLSSFPLFSCFPWSSLWNFYSPFGTPKEARKTNWPKCHSVKCVWPKWHWSKCLSSQIISSQKVTLAKVTFWPKVSHQSVSGQSVSLAKVWFSHADMCMYAKCMFYLKLSLINRSTQLIFTALSLRIQIYFWSQVTSNNR